MVIEANEMPQEQLDSAKKNLSVHSEWSQNRPEEMSMVVNTSEEKNYFAAIETICNGVQPANEITQDQDAIAEVIEEPFKPMLTLVEDKGEDHQFPEIQQEEETFQKMEEIIEQKNNNEAELEIVDDENDGVIKLNDDREERGS